MDSKKDIKSLNLEELKTELESMGEKAFRAKQMYEWMHVKLARSFDEMTNLSPQNSGNNARKSMNIPV